MAAFAPSAPILIPAAREQKIAEEQRYDYKGMPKGWTACCTEAGEVYYHQPALGVSQWSHPGQDPNDVDTGRRHMGSLARELLKRGNGPPQKGPISHSVYDARSRHVPLTTPPSLFDDSATSVVREDLTGRAFALHGILSPAEAASYCQAVSSSPGFAESDVKREFPVQLRNNARLVHFSSPLASTLYRRLAPALRHRDIFLLQPMGFGAEGRWKPSSVNPCFRISRYQEGEHFARHCDGMYTNDDGECSIYSLVIYLNDDFEGGDLEFPDDTYWFKPSAGTAVLFPHDMPHTALEVFSGTKYVARSELMFRCLDRERPPKVPRYAKDPLFQKMAALYEHIGDLVALGDADATTKAYQEALGIQIAHQGTEVKEIQRSGGFLLEDKTWETILSCLEPTEICRATCSVSPKWHAISCSGSMWQEWFKQRWPLSDEVLEGEAYHLEAEMKDWMGLYRREHLLSTSAPFSVIFPSSCVHAYDSMADAMHGPIPAVTRHSETGIGWDRSFKQRQGWSVGGYGYSASRCNTWHKDGQVDFSVLPELFAWSFAQFQLRPSEQHLVVPTLPGLITRLAQERLANILHRRFQVPRLSFASAPLCALAAHGLKTGTVLWGCASGACSVFCFYEEELVGEYGHWEFDVATVEEVIGHFLAAKKELNETISLSVLQHLVISCQPSFTTDQKNGSYRYAMSKVNHDLRVWACPEEVEKVLKKLGEMGDVQIHPMLPGDVILGAKNLANHLPLAMPASSPASWEWRAFAEGQWYRLPAYISAVFEGALRNGKPLASVQLTGRLGMYLVANLEDFTVAVGEPCFFRGRSHMDMDLEHLDIAGSWCPLTRFLRGHPSTEPDRRKPDELEKQLDEVEVVEVQGDAVHVRTLAGKLVFSQKKCQLHIMDLLAECARQMRTSQQRLQLLHGTSTIGNDELQKILEEPVVHLLILVGPEPVVKCFNRESIPEDVPGESSFNSPCLLQKAFMVAMKPGRGDTP